MVKSENFGGYLARMQSESDAESLGKLREYQGLFEKTLKPSTTGVSIDRMACSANLCMASIALEPGATGFREWYAAVRDSGALPMPAMTTHTVHLPNGGLEHRLLFTTNPAYRGLMGGPGPGPVVR
jgi:hypothetical protein